MILVLGGTTEGRKAVGILDKGSAAFYYSTKSDLQKVVSDSAVRITGALDYDGMSAFCREHDIRLIVDAAHPFASRLHATVAEVSRNMSIPVVRYERIYPERDLRLIWCDNFEDAVARLKRDRIKSLLALTGVQTIPKLKDFWHDSDCYFRILNRDESLAKAKSEGFPENRLCFYENDGKIGELIETVHPEAIITKESGESGGYMDKVEEALRHRVKVYVVCRPELPESFEIVTGQYGLRKAVERLVPGFYKLRSGFTTGACATAAAKAAMLAIVADEEPDRVTFTLPDGENMIMKIRDFRLIDDRTASATVIKDAGDDPDVTDGCEVVAMVRLADHGEVRFHGGEGIGVVTLPGIGLEIGEPAINPVPRQMMRNELSALYPAGCDVTVSVPGGEELARRTFNSRIGIVGGISIIGTSGVVMPFSNEAFAEAIARELEVAKALGCERVVLNSGARSEKIVKDVYPQLPEAAFVHYGNAIGESLRIAAGLNIGRITVGIMLGKAVKLAEGNTDTHSHKVVMNREFLAWVADKAGCGPEAGKIIAGINMAKELWSALSEEDAGLFFPYLLSLCKKVCRDLYPSGELEMMLITDSGRIYCVDKE